MPPPRYTVPTLDLSTGGEVADILQERLTALNDLQLTLTHVSWNLVGPNFIGAHRMLDGHVVAVRAMTDVLAERIATLGGSPVGTPGHLAATRGWDDYSLGRERVEAHLAALDLVYDGVVGSHRAAIDATEELDPVTHQHLIEQAEVLERFQWLVRAHLESGGGDLRHAEADSEEEAADLASPETNPEAELRDPGA